MILQLETDGERRMTTQTLDEEEAFLQKSQARDKLHQKFAHGPAAPRLPVVPATNHRPHIVALPLAPAPIPLLS